MSTARKLGVLGALYAAQGLPYGFFTQALPVMLREQGVSLEHIGLASLLAVPWVAKVLWAPLVDRVGRLKTWLLALQGAAIVLAGALALLDPTALRWVLAAVLLTNLVAATQDVATDGLAVAWLRADERGWGNSLQVAGYRVGMIVGGGALLVMAEHQGWRATFGAMAALLALLTVPVGLASWPHPPRPPAGTPAWDWLRRDGALAWVGVLVAFKAGDYLVQGMVRPWLVDLGWAAGDVGLWLGGVGVTAGLAGAVAGGALVTRLGPLTVLRLSGWAQVAALGALAMLAAGAQVPGGITSVLVGEHLVSGVLTTSLFAAMMQASRPESGSTDYTVQASVVVGSSLVAAALSGWGAARLGYAGLFCVGTVLAAVAPWLASRPRSTRVATSG